MNHYQPENFRLPKAIATGWELKMTLGELSNKAGIYAIYSSKTNGVCLYVGKAKNLAKRLLPNHPKWKLAVYEYKAPCIVYKVIDCVHPKTTLRELFYWECLVIGLLRPYWNADPPNFDGKCPKYRDNFVPDDANRNQPNLNPAFRGIWDKTPETELAPGKFQGLWG